MSDSSSSSKPPQSDRLDSWKEIATYLGRSVRTVRRWEATEELPVHRHRHGRGSSIFAYRAELDLWRKARLDLDSSTTEQAQPPMPPRPRRETKPTLPLMVVAALLGTFLIGAATGLLLDRFLVAPPFQEDEPNVGYRILLSVSSRGEIRADEDLFASALRKELSGTAFTPASNPEIHETLRLMRREPSIALDPGLAWEVSQRDGRVNAIVTSFVEPRGSGRLLEVEILHPITGERLERFTEELPLAGQTDRALVGIARVVRRGLEAHVPAIVLPTVAGERVTTSSLSAFRLYTHANELLDLGAMKAAEVLLSDATDKDPDFASAHARLAWVRYRMRRAEGSYLPTAERALTLAPGVSEPERQFIEATHHHLSRRYDLAETAYTAVLREDPEAFWPLRQALALCEDEGSSICTRYRLRLADRRPGDARWNYEAAWGLAVQGENIDAAEATIARARERLTFQAGLADPEAAAATTAFPVGLSWLREDPDRALDEARRVRRELEMWPPSIRDVLAKELGLLFFALGRPGDAEACFREISDRAIRNELLTHLLFLDQQMDELRLHLGRTDVEHREAFSAVVLAVAGASDEAQRLLDELDATGADPSELRVARSVLALIAGESVSVPDDLQVLERESHALFFVLSDMLAGSLHRRGETGRAIEMLEMTRRQRSTAIFAGTGILWLKCQANLAAIYRQAGEEEYARSIESGLLRLLSHAEEDFSLLRELTSRG